MPERMVASIEHTDTQNRSDLFWYRSAAHVVVPFVVTTWGNRTALAVEGLYGLGRNDMARQS